MLNRLAIVLALVFGVGFLAACESAEERAEKHFQKGLELLEAGDADRALVEFRNVFKLNGYHRDARLAYAQVEEQRGNIPAAYSQYLRLAEQYPDDLEGRRALARLALEMGNWSEAERHFAAAQKLSPDDLIVRTVGVAIDYRNARRGHDLKAARQAAAEAENLIEENPDLLSARRIVIGELMRREDWPAALTAIDEALAMNGGIRALHNIRLGVLEQLGRDDEIEAHLKVMIERFPEDESIQGNLVRWYVSRQRMDDAERFLRNRIEGNTDPVEAYTQLVGFMSRFRGREAARAEVERILTETDVAPALFRSIRAGLDFDAGKHAEAIAEMEDILEDAEPSEQTHKIRIGLADMLIRTGNSVGARVQVEEVLENDSTNVAALKLKARWLIESDRTGDAIIELRRALDQSPRDAESLSLLATAYERAGNRELVNEMLSLAVEASNNAPAETLRYARVLLGEGKLLPAEDLLKDGLRLRRGHPQLLGGLGEVYVRAEDWSRVDHVIEALERQGDEVSIGIANQLKASKLAGQNRGAELSTLLDRLAEEEGGLGSIAAVVRLRLTNGDTKGALDAIRKHREADPENPILRFVEATVLAVDGEAETAQEIFRALLEENPSRENVWVALYNLQLSRGEADAATSTLTEGLQALPDSASLNWAHAAELERKGDIEGAIAVYEALYERDSGSQIIANNLASLISSYRGDSESLERAYAIARRLRGTEVPAFQDTYGWIAYGLGNYDEALEYLQPAAESIPDDPLVQFHLAMVFASLERRDEALAQMHKAKALIEDKGRRSEILDQVMAEIARLESEAPVEN